MSFALPHLHPIPLQGTSCSDRGVRGDHGAPSRSWAGFGCRKMHLEIRGDEWEDRPGLASDRLAEADKQKTQGM